MKANKKVALVILDGWGHGKQDDSDGIHLARTPFVDSLYKEYPHGNLVTFGEDVGLPEGQMGNSEVGHMNIGAGRVVYQDLVKINRSIKSGDFQSNPVLLSTIEYANNEGKKVHLLGLVSEGGVHSSQSHLHALCDLFGDKIEADNSVFVHAFTDGRDCSPTSGYEYLQNLEEHIADKPVEIASLVGRYYAMDRDKRWERVKKAYDLMVHGVGTEFSLASEALNLSYSNDITDEFIEPHVNKSVNGKIEPGDVVICFNFRTDRCREITQVLHQENFVDEGMSKLPLHYITMTNYDKTFKGVNVVFDKDELTKTLGEVISDAGLTQLRMAETEKYPHVSFFFSGGREQEFDGESRIMVNSPQVATYDLQPEMSAIELTEKAIEQINGVQPNFICLNYANGDMVGHTGDPNAIVKACETVDSCLKNLVNEGVKKGYSFVVIADHGNADKMKNDDGSAHTAHTLNLVPIIVLDEAVSKVDSGRLADVAPTVLKLLSIEPSKEMNGVSLV